MWKPRTPGGDLANNARVPEAEITGLYGGLLKLAMRKMFGEVPDSAEVMWQNPPTVTDELSAALLEDLGAPALLELTARMTGSAADAEDVVQETWLRWADIGDAARADVRDHRGYLVRIVTRQALNRLRTLARQREEYVGEWLPEPLLTSPDVAEDVELAESLSIAMLAVLETLGPTERAVFVLREVFDVPYDEIAEAVGKSSAAVRQIAHRARQHVAARRPRMAVSRTEQQQAPTARHPVEGRERVVSLLSRFPQFAPKAEVDLLLLNGAVAARIDPAGELDTAVAFAIEDGRIARIYAIRNPHKLGRLEEVAELRR